MRQDSCIRFGPYRLNTADERLWRGREPIVLTPKAFSLLRYLAEHPGRLLTKADLLQAVWADALVTDALHVCIREIREALGDDPRKPQYIETVHRRGYRFVASATRDRRAATACSAGGQRALPPTYSVPFVGRDAEFGRLDGLLQQVLAGERTVALVTGEPGIGKSSLADVFLQRAVAGHDLWVGRGQCFEHLGPGEAYQPVFEAVGQLGRGAGGERICEVLRRLAPTWLAQMPALASAGPAAPPANLSLTRERMLREMAEALEALSSETPLVLLLEDLHWADHATLDLLAYLAQRRGPARLLLLATYRPAEVAAPGHPLRALTQELHARRRCQELTLDLLSEVAVADYLSARFPGCSFAAVLAAVLHRRTEGNPLFLVNVVDQLVAQARLVPAGGTWELAGPLDEVEVGVPESVRGALERQAERLGADEQRVLEAGSVQGTEFVAVAVAAALGRDAEAVERTCAELARGQHFLRGGDQLELPDGSVTARYQFIHALHQEVLYQRLTPQQRLRLHQRIGIWAEGAYGDSTAEVAAELARHFEQGRDFRRAVRYLQQAAEKAARLLAHREAIAHVRKGLKLIPRLPATAESAAQELGMQMALGLQLQVAQGYAAPDAERAYARARELSTQMSDGPQLFPVLWGLWMFYAVRPAYPSAREVADR